MIIKTKFSGEIDIKHENIITFQDGLLGFSDIKKYVIIDMDLDTPFKCLQSVEKWEIAFIIINPWDVFNDYEIDVDDNDISSLGDSEIDNLMLYTLVTITENKVTANLVGPLIINTASRKGRQTVLYKSSYTTKHDILSLVKKV